MILKKTIFSYIWAVLGIPIMLMFIFGADFLTNTLFINNGVKLSTNITGGKIKNTIIHENYKTQIHESVFEGYFCESKKGFVQIDWILINDKFPETIDESVDYDNDNISDFIVNINTVKDEVTLESKNSKVLSISREKLMVLDNQLSIRVNLHN